MTKNFIEELKWRGMLYDQTPGLENLLKEGQITGYIGFDPTAASLHIGNLATVMLLVHFQRAGHKPIALVGGATGMVGDPSGKSQERNLLDESTLRYNQDCIKSQLTKFLDFKGKNAAVLVNNYDWYQHFTLLNFLRDVGKNLTVNYMLAKDSVQKRLETGLSFTEFSYQLLQGYDFYYLYKHHDCRLQMGGSDQWGNMTAGMEFIRRLDGGESHVLTTPLVTKSDGTKFGKSEEGNVWLDASMTSPYKFYQFWLNVSDEDAPRLLRVFSLLEKEEIEALEKEHQEAPHLRAMQKKLAEEVTKWVHSENALKEAQEATELLFGKMDVENVNKLGENVFKQLSDSIPYVKVKKADFLEAEGVYDLLSDRTEKAIFPSRGEVRKMVQNNGLLINKEKVNEGQTTGELTLLAGKYLLVQKGKKNYYLVEVVG